MLDLAIVWGVTKTAELVFWPVLEELAKDSARDYTKDFFKGCLKNVLRRPEATAPKTACGKALKEFLQLMQKELQEAGYQEAQIKPYLEPLKQFVKQETIATTLGQAFEVDRRTIDTALLAQTWKTLQLPALPEDFDWDLVGKLYVRAVKQIIQESAELRAIFTAQIQAMSAEGMQDLVGITPEFDLKHYAAGLREQYGNLKLESLDTTGVYYNELKLWKIFIPQKVRECQEFLPQVYEIPKEHGRRLRQDGQLDGEEILATEVEQHRRVYAEQPIRPVFEVVGDPTGVLSSTPLQHTVVLGDPGSGKSTLLQYLALIWAERPVRELPLHPIPLLIELRTYGRDKQAGKVKDILSFIHAGNVTCRLAQHQLDEKLKSGQAIVLCDGIDEVFDPALRDEVVTDIHRLTLDYSKVQVIVTSRWLGYKSQRLRDAGYRHFMLQDLEAEQIETFIQRWHDLLFLDGADKVRKRDRLQKAIHTSKAIRELAGNPLLLTMMAILNRNQELPRDRPELYNQASRVLLHQWDVERALVEDPRLDPKTIDYRDKQAMLRKVAYHMQSNAKGLAGNLISATDLEVILATYLKEVLEIDQPKVVARAMIQQLRTRNFILCYLGADSYAFVHRTFLEYFCAWEFVWQFKETQTLSFEQLKQDVLGAHWRDESWHEVLRLIAGMIEAQFVGQVIDYLLEQKVDRGKFLDENRYQKKEGLSNLLLAAYCFGEVRNKAAIAPTSTKLLKTLQHEIEQEYPYWFAEESTIEITSLIATFWQENGNTLPWLKQCLQFSSSPFVPKSAVQAIAQAWKDDPGTLPWLKNIAQTDQSEDVRWAAVEALARGWKDDPNTLPWLKNIAQTDQDEDVHRAVVEALVRGWKDDPDTLPWLKNIAQTDQDEDVHRAAVEALARGWKDDPDTLPWLKNIAQNAQDGAVCWAAVAELAQGWKNDPDTLPWLKNIAQNAQDGFVRWVAGVELARGWKHDPDALPWLKNIVQNAQDGDVRWAAVAELVRGWKHDPDTLPWLKTFAQTDQDGVVRRVAVAELARGWKHDPDTLPWLKNIAQTDQDEDVRRVAVPELARGWKDDPDTLPWLKNIAQNDPFKNVRRVAVAELARGWKHDPDTLPWLKNIAQNDPFGDVRRAAGVELARGWKDDPDTLPWLKNIAQNDPFGDVRRAAVAELARGWKDDPDTLPMLKTRAQTDQDGNVRRVAVAELARRWKNDPDTLPMLKNLTQTDQFWYVRRVAVEALARGWKDDPDTVPWLKNIAQTDQDGNVRWAAVSALVQGWKGNPDTLPMLKNIAQTDQDWTVRRAAVSALVRGWKDDPDTVPWLKNIAQTDQDGSVRWAAISALARGWKDDPGTLSWLKTCT